ncbi:MAG: hypothetical protein HYR87_10110, partial [Thaumarchaeota archaeon]|nr:hypothetical protein [Nitrososphaerota archaeon]
MSINSRLFLVTETPSSGHRDTKFWSQRHQVLVTETPSSGHRDTKY